MNWTEMIVYTALIALMGWAILRETKQRKENEVFLAKAMKQVYELIEKQSTVNMNQIKLNQEIGNNLELLGVHTKLIHPSIGFEASAFLAWNEKMKEEDNG